MLLAPSLFFGLEKHQDPSSARGSSHLTLLAEANATFQFPLVEVHKTPDLGAYPLAPPA